MIWSNKELSKALGIKIVGKDIVESAEVDTTSDQRVHVGNMQHTSDRVGNIKSHDYSFGEIQFNSLDVKEGDIFIALSGNRDGHLFVKDAIERGASAVIISQKLDDIDQKKVILVEDTTIALKKLAEYKRANSKAKFIAITGSVGKTSTKEALKLMLEPFGKVFASKGNFNNFLGVPLSLASMPNNIEFAIFEVGMNHSGEISELTKLIRPDIAIITSIAEVHIGNFDSINGIIDAKSEIFIGMKPESLAIINNDNDEYTKRIYEHAKFNKLKKIYFFGGGKSSQSKLVAFKNIENKSYLKYEVGDKQVKVELDKLPEHFAHNFASGLLLVDLLGFDLKIASKALDQFKVIDGRGKIITVTKGEAEYQIICDYYTSNPTSLTAALKSLAQFNDRKKIIIIGDMLELGERSEELHESVIPYIINSIPDKLILVGNLAPKIANKIPSNITVKSFEDIDQLINNLSNILSNNELILVKGSKKLMMWKILTYFDKEKNAV